MKTYSIILGIVAGVLLLVGRLLIILHWGGGRIMNFLGITVACFFALSIAYQAFSYQRKDHGSDRKIDEIGKDENTDD